MNEEREYRVGEIVWRDLTVDDADAIRKFYCEVVGWKSTPHDMGDYQDFNIVAPERGETVAGICHARGSNANLPPQWLLYIWVADVEASARLCVDLGGRILDGPRMTRGQRFCAIEDPAGAVVALMSS